MLLTIQSKWQVGLRLAKTWRTTDAAAKNMKAQKEIGRNGLIRHEMNSLKQDVLSSDPLNHLPVPLSRWFMVWVWPSPHDASGAFSPGSSRFFALSGQMATQILYHLGAT